LEEGGLNPKTSCGGTSEEMVCSGGEKAFITRIIEDSTALKQSFRYPFFYMDWIAFLFLMCKC
jgi:23S rRNA (adenine1618-N6)-methyltransferase